MNKIANEVEEVSKPHGESAARFRFCISTWLRFVSCFKAKPAAPVPVRRPRHSETPDDPRHPTIQGQGGGNRFERENTAVSSAYGRDRGGGRNGMSDLPGAYEHGYGDGGMDFSGNDFDFGQQGARKPLPSDLQYKKQADQSDLSRLRTTRRRR